MGHHTITNRQFIKVDSERFIPYVIATSSNTTTTNSQGREVYCKDTFALNIGGLNVVTLESVKKAFDSELSRLSSVYLTDLYPEYKTIEDIKDNFAWLTTFRLSGRLFISLNQIMKWYESGVKSAMTIEEMREIDPYLSISYYQDINYKTIKTTEELIACLDDEYYQNKQLYVYRFPIFLDERAKHNKQKQLEKPIVAVSKYYTTKSQSGSSYKIIKRKLYTTYSEYGKKFRTKGEANAFVAKINKKYGITDISVREIILDTPKEIIFR